MIDFYMKKVTTLNILSEDSVPRGAERRQANSYAESLQSAPISLTLEAQRIMFRDILSSTQSAQSIISDGHNL
jgi:hypothetical protein